MNYNYRNTTGMQETQCIKYENMKFIRLYNPRITSINIEIN